LGFPQRKTFEGAELLVKKILNPSSSMKKNFSNKAMESPSGCGCTCGAGIEKLAIHSVYFS